ncbi:hypothetical protein [Leptospira noguchii]|uniref:hypothetical protein n=1 Tax=Leptospira noguchii TaxID=28182 RepID=UPI001FB75829|nr:hypothetical protein [Leptospira noguchii]UOG47929.1 hypothetical protein MAL00_12825 [Leptospira noguchii]
MQRLSTITNPTSIWISILNLRELRQILCKTEFPPHNAIHRERCALVSNATLQSDPGSSANASLRIGIQGAMH